MSQVPSMNQPKNTKPQAYYTHGEELWNTWTHAAGIVMGVAAVLAFVQLYAARCSALAVTSMSLYFAGMLSCYVSSTLYHALPAGSHAKAVLRRFDHAAIFWHIAGSYAPLTMIGLWHEGYWGLGLTAFVGTAAVVGTVVVFRNLSDHSHLETIAFVAMGLSILAAFNPLAQTVPPGVIWWLVAEGVMYITGAVFYSLHGRHYMHTVFHFFVLAGSACHMVALWYLLEHAA